MASTRRSRFRKREQTLTDPMADVNAGGSVDASSEWSPDAGERDLESMTAKGIKHLCSELLELKKASDEEFHRTISVNLSAFIRIFEEVGGVESELMTLKQHILSQKDLVQDLMSNLYLEIISDDSQDIEAEETENHDLCSANKFEAHRCNILEALDLLLIEHRNDEALIVLEMETYALRKLQIKEEHVPQSIFSYMSAISERRSRVADQFAFVADNPRVAQPELHMALTGLCRLGENTRANHLLLKFYRSHLESCMHELRCSIPFLQEATPFLQEIYIRELAKIIFSAISQAARSFIMLYGETYLHTSELVQWAREEIESFSHSFDDYIKSVSEINGGLSLAIEVVSYTISWCALLKRQKIFLQPYFIKLIRPCMEEVLQIHMNHYKKVVSCYATNETWVLNEFPSTQILKDKASSSGNGGEVEFCLLSSSGRNFITLMQGIVDDISPLTILQIESSILKGLTDLFNEYMHALEKAMQNRENDVEANLPRISYAQELEQQLSLIVNSSTLVHFLPSIVDGIFDRTKPSNHKASSEHTEFSSQTELHNWALSTQEVADQLRGCFCQQFVHDIMLREYYLETSLKSGQLILSSSEVPMPSFAFQALFLRLNHLKLSKSIAVIEHGTVRKLLEELMQAVIKWLSNNREFWGRAKDRSFMPQYSHLGQVDIDIHFLLETAIFGGFFSDELMVAALDLLSQIRETFTAVESDPYSDTPDNGWALEAAKLAIEKLLEIKVDNSEHEEETPQDSEVGSLSERGNPTESSDDYTHSVTGSDESSDEDATQLLEIKNTRVESPEGYIEIGGGSDEESWSLTPHTNSTKTPEIEAKVADELLDAAVAYSDNTEKKALIHQSRDIADAIDKGVDIKEELATEATSGFDNDQVVTEPVHGDGARPKGGQERPKHSSVAEGSGKNRKGLKSPRPRWH